MIMDTTCVFLICSLLLAVIHRDDAAFVTWSHMSSGVSRSTTTSPSSLRLSGLFGEQSSASSNRTLARGTKSFLLDPSAVRRVGKECLSLSVCCEKRHTRVLHSALNTGSMFGCHFLLFVAVRIGKSTWINPRHR